MSSSSAAPGRPRDRGDLRVRSVPGFPGVLVPALGAAEPLLGAPTQVEGLGLESPEAVVARAHPPPRAALPPADPPARRPMRQGSVVLVTQPTMRDEVGHPPAP